jgi:hypothetical protein
MTLLVDMIGLVPRNFARSLSKTGCGPITFHFQVSARHIVREHSQYMVTTGRLR